MDMILKAERGQPADRTLEGMVFRHPRYGPVEVVQIVNEPLASGRYMVHTWVTPATGPKESFLKECEVSLERLLQSFEGGKASAATCA